MSERPPETIAVVAAMSEEIEPLRRRLENARNGPEGRPAWTRGRLNGIDLVLAVTGEGRRNAERGIARVLEEHRPDRVLAIGLAGALSETLRVGDVLLAGEVLDGEEAMVSPDPGWLARARQRGPCEVGRLITVDEILASPAAKARWAAAAIGAPALVDMESASYARVASAFRLPYLVARAVSDCADETLPQFLTRCRDREGGVDRRLVLRHALPRPASWPALLRLRSRTKRCAQRLADLTEVVIAAA